MGPEKCVKNCKKRSLVQKANAVFKDARIAKKWLTTDKEFDTQPYQDRRVDTLSPINAISRDDIAVDDVLCALYISAAMDDGLFERESFDERAKRLFEMTITMGFKRSDNGLSSKTKFLKTKPFGMNDTVGELLENKESTNALEGALIKRHKQSRSLRPFMSLR